MPKNHKFLVGEALTSKIMNDNLMQDSQILQTTGISSTDVMSQKSVSTEFAKKTDMQFDDINNDTNYIGKHVGILPISVGTHIFTNCTGTINYSGSAANLYIINSPKLAVNYVRTLANWNKIWIDGVAYSGSVYNNATATMWTDGTMIQWMRISGTGSIVFPVVFADFPDVNISSRVTRAQPVYATISYPADINCAGFTLASVGYYKIGEYHSDSPTWEISETLPARNFAGNSFATIIGRWKL